MEIFKEFRNTRLKLSREALVQLATEETVFPKAQDALDRLTFLVGPVFLQVDAEKRVTGPIVSETVENNFGLKLPASVADALLFRMGKHNFVATNQVGDSPIFFGKGSAPQRSQKSVLDELIKDLRLFVSDKSLLPKITDDEIVDLFLEKVFELVDELEETPASSSSFTGEKWKKSLISDYILHHTGEDGTLPPLLTRLAELCLLRNVVDQLGTQKRLSCRSSLRAILDAPLVLFAIGASGKQQQKSIQATLETAKSLGVQITLLPTSIMEMKRVLNGTLSREHSERTGLTAAAIRRGDLLENIASDMRSNPEKYAKNEGITLLTRTLETFPQEEHFFTEQEYKDFSVTASTWSNNEAAEFHDAECLTIAVRARGGKHDRNMFQNKYVFLTNNWRFVTSARRMCLETFKINESSCPPVLHFDTFAANVWISGGFEKNKTIPSRTLLAACERAISGHQSILSKTSDLIKKLQLTDDETLDLFLEDRDCVDAIVSQVGYDPSLINEENVSVLVDVAKAAIAKDVATKAAAEKKALEEDFTQRMDETVKESQSAIAAMRVEMETFRSEVDATLQDREERILDLERQQQHEHEERKNSIRDRVAKLNEKTNRKGWGLIEWFETVFFVVASVMMGFQGGLIFGIAASIFGLVFMTMSHFDIWLPSKLKKGFIRRYSEAQIRREFSAREREDWGISLNDEFEITFAE